jgi:hypothetical protein
MDFGAAEGGQVQRPFYFFLARLKRLPNVGGSGWKFICPLATGSERERRDHVLKVDMRPDGKTLNVYCHNGCSTEDVLKAMNLRFSDLYPVRQVGRGRRGPAQSDEVRLARAGLSDSEIKRTLARARGPRR